MDIRGFIDFNSDFPAYHRDHVFVGEQIKNGSKTKNRHIRITNRSDIENSGSTHD